MIRNTITGSQPFHLHANGNARVLGWAKAFWQQVAGNLCNGTCNGETPCRLEVVTCSTFLPHTTAIERSCRYWGVGIVRLAPPKRTPWHNWLRHGLSAEHCRRTKAEWLLFTDATDAVFVRHPQAAMDVLQAMNQPALIAAEHNHWPDDCPVKPYDGTYANGNGGGVIGRREVLLELFEEAGRHRSAHCPRSDQYGTRVAAERVGVLPDTEAAIFQTLAFTKPGEVELS